MAAAPSLAQHQQSSPTRLSSAERRRLAVELRLNGASYSQIGTTLGINKKTAWKHVMAALADVRKATAEGASQVRQLELLRLDKMELSLSQQPQVPQVILTRLRVQERRARLLGLDAPIQIDATEHVTHAFDFTGVPTEELERVRAVLRRARALPQPPAAAAVLDVQPTSGNGVPKAGNGVSHGDE